VLFARSHRRLPKGPPEHGRVSWATNVLHTIAIKLKIPDNTAFSALSALRRLGVEVDRVERADIWQFAGPASGADVAASVRRNESLFNPNKHALELRESPIPQSGEAWVSTIAATHAVAPDASAAAVHHVGWRLFDKTGAPVPPGTLKEAVEKLLCNPAIERAIT